MNANAGAMTVPADVHRPDVASTPTRPAGPYAFSADLVVAVAPTSPRAEAIRALRTHIMAQHVEDGRRALAICSASGSTGTTFIAVNLAVALSQVGLKVLLIDGNLRKPTIDQYIHSAEKRGGLREYLEVEGAELADYIDDAVLDNFSVMFSGGAAPGAQELLASNRFAEFADRCMRDFDLTIFDTPPANTCADARRIATVCGYALVVAKRHESFVADVKALADQLREDRACLIGAVMTED